jgi:hypothetical protein
MAYTTINKSTDYFNNKLYTGTGSSNAITGVGFPLNTNAIPSAPSKSLKPKLFW